MSKLQRPYVHMDSEFNFRRVAGTWIAAVGLLRSTGRRSLTDRIADTDLCIAATFQNVRLSKNASARDGNRSFTERVPHRSDGTFLKWLLQRILS
jgi:hypothetical protein